jgi:3-deoxy-D-manno-octulosonic-acid transferase
MLSHAMRLLYTLLLYLLLPLVLARLWWRGRANTAYRRHWRERLGHVDVPQGRYLWVHAVSVGESIAAAPLIRRLMATYPERRVLVTTTTPTGRDQVARLFGDAVEQTYFPYDLPGVLSRFLHRVRPEALVILETELWPNLLVTCRKRGIPVLVANARLSEKSFGGYRRLRPLFRGPLSGVAAVAARGDDDARRFLALGVREQALHVVGNIKYDLSVPVDLPARGVALREGWNAGRAVWVAASTHAGEDEIVLDAHAEILQQVPETLLILVPRHPERFDAVAELCEERGFSTVRRSGDHGVDEDTDVLVGDTLGELMLFYAASDVAFVGGSFVKVGGHNPLEPAVLGRPVVTGPVIFNFQEAYATLREADAVIVLDDEDELAPAVQRLLVDRSLNEAVGERARGVVEANRGATERTVTLVRELLVANA